MPNYAYNALKIEDTALAQQVFAYMKSGHNLFDFNKIIPMPDDIYQENITPAQSLETGEGCWYNWCLNNWGTKWNAMDAEIHGNVVKFLTAWDPVPDLIIKLMDKFDVQDFDYYYTDEEDGMGCGAISRKNGDTNFEWPGDETEETYAIWELAQNL